MVVGEWEGGAEGVNVNCMCMFAYFGRKYAIEWLKLRCITLLKYTYIFNTHACMDT